MEQNAIYIHVRQSVYAVRLDTILYMEQEGREITIHSTEGENIRFYGEYSRLLPLLDDRFVHPHRSYVINMQQIFRIGKNEAVMFGGDRIVMGSRCFARLRKAYIAYINENIRSRLEMDSK